MKIATTLKKAGKTRTISSEEVNMYEQDESSLVHWLLIDGCDSKEEKATMHKKLLEAKDWKLDPRPKR